MRWDILKIFLSFAFFSCFGHLIGNSLKCWIFINDISCLSMKDIIKSRKKLWYLQVVLGVNLHNHQAIDDLVY